MLNKYKVVLTFESLDEILVSHLTDIDRHLWAPFLFNFIQEEFVNIVKNVVSKHL